MGGTNSSPTALGLGISAPHPPQISEFCLGLGGGTKVFYPLRPDNRRFKIPSFTSLSHTHRPPRTPSLSAELWVICYHLGNLSQLRITVGGARAPQRAGDRRETAQSSCNLHDLHTEISWCPCYVAMYLRVYLKSLYHFWAQMTI